MEKTEKVTIIVKDGTIKAIGNMSEYHRRLAASKLYINDIELTTGMKAKRFLRRLGRRIKDKTERRLGIKDRYLMKCERDLGIEELLPMRFEG